MSHYRDPLAGLAGQVALKRSALDDRERAMSPLLFSLLPPALRRTIEELRPRARAGEGSLEALSAAEAALDAILAAYDEATRLAPSLRACPDEVGDPPRPKMPQPWLIEERGLLRLRKCLAAALADVAPGALLVRWGDRGYVSRFRVASVPFVLRVLALPSQDGPWLVWQHCDLRTSVPHALARLEIKRRRAHHAVGRALRLVRELETGDAELDARFHLAGATTNVALLTAELRDAITLLEPLSPALVVDDGVATLAWSGPTDDLENAELVPRAAMRALSALRSAVRRA
ncbi:MAG: hypothetical protein KF819_36520 [Labilithrix sp.]|nr:hypothetical protein [Labilithrix sp.]